MPEEQNEGDCETQNRAQNMVISFTAYKDFPIVIHLLEPLYCCGLKESLIHEG